MDPATTAALISAGSNLLGGFLGGKKKPLHPQEVIKINRLAQRAEFQEKMDLAKTYGIHPLTMLGVQSSSPIASHVQSSGSGGDLGQSIAMAGNDISRAVSAGQSRLEKLQERLLTAQIEGQEIDNVSRASMVARAHQPGNPPTAPSIGEKLQDVPLPVGYSRGFQPLHTVAVDENGDVMRVYNTNELGDNEVLQALHTIGYTLPDWIHGKVRRVGNSVRSWWNRSRSSGSSQRYLR